ncbi:MAG: uncharacterized protein QOI62_3244 [Solirubrobacteraceae bacterium]|jgi:uncharacterized protein with von Willebrand factor type A (vWA) domain|nr:uncharacterized protein [Solirubrobacteraceae bacterium]
MSSSLTDPLERLTRFGRALRRAGLPVGSGRILEFSRAVALLPPGDLYWAGRATLIARPEDIREYDRIFAEFFGAEETGFRRAPREATPPTVKTARPGAPSGPADDDALKAELSLASPIELLRHKSFSECTADELEELLGALDRLVIPTRRSRRYRSARVGDPDFRRTLRASFRTAGEPIDRAWRRRRRTPRRVVLLLDVSGSMATYSRALLFFAHAGVRAHGRWEAFCFATRLTRVTRALATGSPDEALARAAADVVDWDGGTRIGASIKRFLDDHGHRGMARGAVVIVCSDGLEIGDPGTLGEQMERLSRLAHRVVWLNPLKEDPAYEPLARGMRAALPYVDVFASGHNLASLEALAEGLARPASRPFAIVPAATLEPAA